MAKISIVELKCGMMVMPKLLKIEAMITAISIRFDRTTYELTYPFQGEYKTIWCFQEEFEIRRSDKNEIGFAR